MNCGTNEIPVKQLGQQHYLKTHAARQYASGIAVGGPTHSQSARHSDFDVPDKQQTLGQSWEAQKEVPQTAVHLVADRGWMQKGAILIDPRDPHVKMPNFTAEINMFLAWIQSNLFWI